MACKCQTLPNDHEGPGSIIFTSNVAELMNIFISKIETQFPIEKTDMGYVLIKSDNVRECLSHICQKTNLSASEKHDLNIIILDKDEVLDIACFSRIMPLDRMCGIVQSSNLIQILQDESITTWFQPIVDVKTREIFAYECLLRGVLKDNTFIPPGELFEQATQADLVFNLDRLARETSLKTAAVKRITKNVFINFLPSAIYDPANCLKSTQKWAENLEYDFTKIVFEVVETERIKDTVHLKRILDYYHEQGFRVALDDVGSGYSSLNLLAELKPDFIKIDMNLVRGIHEDSMKQSIFKALIDIAKDNNIIVLAEGVETCEELHYLEQHAVDLVQGYLFAKPSAEPIRQLAVECGEIWRH